MLVQLPGGALITHRRYLFICLTLIWDINIEANTLGQRSPDTREPDPFDKHLWASLGFGHGGYSQTLACVLPCLLPKGLTPHTRGS